MKQQIGRLLSTLLLATFSLGITAGVIQGTIIDKQTKEPLTELPYRLPEPRPEP